MAKDRENMGGPTVNRKDSPIEVDKEESLSSNNAQSQSNPEGDDERRNREGAGKSRRSGSESNAS